MGLAYLVSSLLAITAPDSLTAAEVRVREIVGQDGIHVVHFWAPWCANSLAELREGWAELIETNGDITFTFVTIWSLAQYAIPARVLELTQEDVGPSRDRANRRRTFLGLPVTWIPTTWVFHNNGSLAFAMNYGEMKMEIVQSLLDVTRQPW
jgi:hypothetical protein